MNEDDKQLISRALAVDLPQLAMEPNMLRVPAALHDWNPPHCGDSGMRIAADGSWTHDGAPIARPDMVRLFSSILRRDADEFVLVTPSEKLSIAVEDSPFIAVELIETGVPALLQFRTNVGEVITAGSVHPLRFEGAPHGGIRPYLLVRDALWARLTRSVSLDLLSRAEQRLVDGALRIGIAAGDAFFDLPESAGASDVDAS